jgi:hypothetical protein
MTNGDARVWVGIVEWSRRARGARATELRIADAYGAAIASAPTGGDKIALARAARRHGWHAELWADVVPVLHDVDAALAGVDTVDGVQDVTDGDDPQAAADRTVRDLTEHYRAWLDSAAPVADGPTIRVLRLVLAPEPRAERP